MQILLWTGKRIVLSCVIVARCFRRVPDRMHPDYPMQWIPAVGRNSRYGFASPSSSDVSTYRLEQGDVFQILVVLLPSCRAICRVCG